MANEIEVKAAKATAAQLAIGVTSEKYRPVANRTALLFFVMSNLMKMHSYYIYSLAAFTKVYILIYTFIHQRTAPTLFDHYLIIPRRLHP